MEDEYIHSEEVHQITGLSVDALSQLRYRGQGPKFYKPTARTVIYKRSEVIAWIGNSAFTSPSPAMA